MNRTAVTWYRLLGLLVIAAMVVPPATLADSGTPTPDPAPIETEPPAPIETEPPASVETEPPAPSETEPPGTEPPAPVSTETAEPEASEPVSTDPVASESVATEPSTPVETAISTQLASLTLTINGQTGTVVLEPGAELHAEALPWAFYDYWYYDTFNCQGESIWPPMKSSVGFYTSVSTTAGTVGSVKATNTAGDSACTNFVVNGSIVVEPPPPPSFTLTVGGQTGTAWLQPSTYYPVRGFPEEMYIYRTYIGPDCQGEHTSSKVAWQGIMIKTGASEGDASISASIVSGQQVCVNILIRNDQPPLPTPTPPPPLSLAIDGQTGTAWLQPHTDYLVQASPSGTHTYLMYASLDCQGVGAPLATTATGFTLTTGAANPGNGASISVSNTTGETVCLNIQVGERPHEPLTLTINGQTGTVWLAPGTDITVEAHPPGSYTYRWYLTTDCQGSYQWEDTISEPIYDWSGPRGLTQSIWASNDAGETSCVTVISGDQSMPTPTPDPAHPLTLYLNSQTGTVWVEPDTRHHVEAVPVGRHIYYWYDMQDCQGPATGMTSSEYGVTDWAREPGTSGSIRATNLAGESACLSIIATGAFIPSPTPTPPPTPDPASPITLTINGQSGPVWLPPQTVYHIDALPDGFFYEYYAYDQLDCQGPAVPFAIQQREPTAMLGNPVTRARSGRSTPSTSRPASTTS